jgi:hypothetical protein
MTCKLEYWSVISLSLGGCELKEIDIGKTNQWKQKITLSKEK